MQGARWKYSWTAYKVDYLKESFQPDKLNKFKFDTFTVVKGTKNRRKTDKNPT